MVCKMLSCRCTVNSYATSMLLELLIRVALLFIFLITDEMDPFQRVIQPEEMWLYKNPHREHSTVSSKMMFGSVTLVPLCAIIVCSLLRKDRQDFIQAVLACSLALLLNGIITNSIKLIIARPRPDFVARCFPDGVITADLRCTGDPYTIKQGRKSFPSGHSSFAFCGFGFASLYLAGKLHVLERQGRGIGWRILVPLIPVYMALMVALSRTADYRHHYEDVAVGSLLGLAVAFVLYRQFYPPLTHTNCDMPYATINPRWESLPLESGVNAACTGSQSKGQFVKMV